MTSKTLYILEYTESVPETGNCFKITIYVCTSILQEIYAVQNVDWYGMKVALTNGCLLSTKNKKTNELFIYCLVYQ